MPASIILHLGPHKTATSLVQEALLRAETGLRTEGVKYSAVGRTLAAHHLLAFALWSPERRGNILSVGQTMPSWSDLRAEADELPDGDKLIVSSENFSHVRDSEIHGVAPIRGLDVSLIVGLRDPMTLVPSMWQESVKWGRLWSLTESLPELTSEDRTTLVPIVDRWQRATGAANVHAVVIPADTR